MIYLPSKLFVLLLVAATFILSVFTTIATAAQRKSNKTTLTVGYLTAMKEGPSDRQGLAISGAFTMAIDQVNKDENLLPNVTLTLRWNDTRGDTVLATKAITEMICNGTVTFFGPEGSCYVGAIVSQSHNIPMISYQRPRIMEHPADAIATKEEPLTLNCKATGRPPPEISWYHNGTPLVPSERRVILPEGSLFFLRVLHNKREQDSGVYWCEARSKAGIAVSKNATLQIAALKDDFRSVPKDTVALVGAPVVMNCIPPRGIPEPSVLWYKDGKLLDLSGKKLSMIEGGSLMISEVQASDGGRYKCTAQNMATTRSAPPAMLKVLAPPSIIRGPQDTEVIEGEGLDIPCEITGDPKPYMSWNREDGYLPEGRSRILLDNTLRIEDVRAEDQGRYTCNGYNEGGNISVTIKLNVYAIPSFIVAPTDADVEENDSVSIPCRATGRPKTIVIWDKIHLSNNDAQANDKISRLLEEEAREQLMTKAKIMSFRTKREQHKYQYQLQNFSTFSSLQMINRIVRSVLTVSSQEMLLKDKTGNIVSFASETTQRPEITTVSDILELPSFETTKSGELIFKNVTKKDEGWYACAAINEAGSIVKKIYLHIKTVTNIDKIEYSYQIHDLLGNRWGGPQNILITTIQSISAQSADITWELAQANVISSTAMAIYYRPIVHSDINVKILSKDYLVSFTTIDKKLHRLTDLKPHTVYEVFATVPNGLAGSVSNLRRGKTMDGPPSAPPTDVRVGVINNTAAYVRWSPPPLHLLNGALTGYKIQIKSNITNKLLGQMSLNASTQSVVINSLSPGGKYIARVAPLTAGGLGPYSPPTQLHMDLSFLARPPKTNPTLNSWTTIWMPGVILCLLGVCLIGGAILAVSWARKKKRNYKASYPTIPIATSYLSDKSRTLWLHDNTIIKPTHSFGPLPVPSEYAEVTSIIVPKQNNAPPEPYATVTLQRKGGISNIDDVGYGEGGKGISSSIISSSARLDDSCRKCSASPSSSEYNAPIRMPMNICEILPPPPNHPYGSKPPNNMTIRSNPAALSPYVLRRIPPMPLKWDILSLPIPNLPQNWMSQEKQQKTHLKNSENHLQPENEYEYESVLYEQFYRDNETSYFNEGGEPTEEYYRNVNMEFFEDQEFESSPPPPCADSTSSGCLNSNPRLIVATNDENFGGRSSCIEGNGNGDVRQCYRSHDISCESICNGVNNGNTNNSSDDSESG